MGGNEIAKAISEGEERVRAIVEIFAVRRDNCEPVNVAVAEPCRQKNIEAPNSTGGIAGADMTPSADPNAINENAVDQYIHRCGILVCVDPAGKAQSAEPAHRTGPFR